MIYQWKMSFVYIYMLLVKGMGKSNFYDKNYKHLCPSPYTAIFFILSTQFPIVIDEVLVQFDIDLFIIFFF